MEGSVGFVGLALAATATLLMRKKQSAETCGTSAPGCCSKRSEPAARPDAEAPAIDSDIAQVIAAELTWTGSTFERDIRVAISSRGQIVAVGPASEVTAAVTKELPGMAIMPGMINCHSHAFQRMLRGVGDLYPAHAGENSFWTWREEMYKLVEGMTRDAMFDACKQCFDEMRQAGVTSVGEFHYFHHPHPEHETDQGAFAYDQVVLEAARAAGIRIVMLNAYYSRGGFSDEPLSAGQQRFKTTDVDAFLKHTDALAAANDKLRESDPHAADLVTFGLVAHSLRACGVDDFAKLHTAAKERGVPFHAHVEEQPKEVSDCKLVHGKDATPMGLVNEAVVVDSLTTAIHCNHCEAEQLETYIKRGGNVCICPLTEGHLGDGIMATATAQHAFKTRPAAEGKPAPATGNSVCLGTDCNARIDLIEEMRWLEYARRLAQLRRGVAVTLGRGDEGEASSSTDDAALQLLACATANGARSLGIPAGRIAPGLWADFAVVDLAAPCLSTAKPDTLLPTIIFGGSAEAVICGNCVGGSWQSSKAHAPVPGLDSTVEVAAVAAGAGSGAGAGSAEDGGVVLQRHNIDVSTLPAVAQTAVKFISCKSNSGDEVDMAKLLRAYLTERGWYVTLQPVAAQGGGAGPTRFNVYAQRLKPRPVWESGEVEKDDFGPKLIINSHIDTVPPYFPARLSEDGTFLHGNGSNDTKGVIATQLHAVEGLLAEHPELEKDIGLLYVVSEEVDHSGMKAAGSGLHLRPQHLIVGEPTCSKLAVVQKGMLKVRVVANGTACHSGYPEQGHSAVHALLKVLMAFRGEEWHSDDPEELGSTTINIGTVEGGQAANALAEYAEAMVFFRACCHPSVLLKRAQELAAEHGEGIVKVVVFTQNAPVYLGRANVPGLQTTSVCFNTDIAFFDWAGASEEERGTAYMFGPGDICEAHCSRERIAIEDMVKGVGTYTSIIKDILGVE